MFRQIPGARDLVLYKEESCIQSLTQSRVSKEKWNFILSSPNELSTNVPSAWIPCRLSQNRPLALVKKQAPVV